MANLAGFQKRLDDYERLVTAALEAGGRLQAIRAEAQKVRKEWVRLVREADAAQKAIFDDTIGSSDLTARLAALREEIENF